MNRLLAALRPAPRPAPRSAFTAVRAAVAPAACTDSEAPSSAATGVEPPGACGWFDSSHALQHGLCVTEHVSADAVAAHLPLDDWLQLHLHLGGWPGLQAVEATRAAGVPAH
jgi:hypothetical protein